MKSVARVWKDNDRRTRSGFLWRPRSVRIYVEEVTLIETRWLEHARWEERCVRSWGDEYWVTERFIDDEEVS